MIVTTALSPDLESGFYFRMVPKQYYALIDAFLGIKFDSELAQISLPQVYRHRPLYNIPLYHELGHFLDMRHSVSAITLLTHPLPQAPASLVHRREHFADLFCSCYMGAAFTAFLVDYAGMQPASSTHPATVERVTVVENFLNGTPDRIVTMFQAALALLNLRSLVPRFSVPAVAVSFDSVCPCKISSTAELHGFLIAGYDYLKVALATFPAPWNDMPPTKVESVINDLAEKSIRNYMISARWSQSTSRP